MNQNSTDKCTRKFSRYYIIVMTEARTTRKRENWKARRKTRTTILSKMEFSRQWILLRDRTYSGNCFLNCRYVTWAYSGTLILWCSPFQIKNRCRTGCWNSLNNESIYLVFFLEYYSTIRASKSSVWHGPGRSLSIERGRLCLWIIFDCTVLLIFYIFEWSTGI